MMINTIVFDFGRVISAQKPDSLFLSYEKDLGLEPGSINSLMFDSPRWQQALIGQIDMDTYWQTIGPSLNLHSHQAIRNFQKKYYHDEKINTGTLQLIQKLHKNYKLAILSNHPSGLQQWLADWQIDSFFDEIICSADQGMTKPDTKIFDLLLNKLKISPEQTVFIDDTPEHVLASLDIGIHGILFSTADQLAQDLKKLHCM